MNLSLSRCVTILSRDTCNMDLSDALKSAAISAESNGENVAEDSKIIPALSKLDQFFATYERQSFSLPDSIMLYIAKNPPTPELHQKLVESCKYFFAKNPVIVVWGLWFENGQWEIDGKPYDLEKFSCKFWITDHIMCETGDSDKQNFVSSVIPKLYRCEAIFIALYNQVISFHDLSFIISSAKDILLEDVIVKENDGSNVAAEKIFEVAVKAKRITLESDTILPNVTSNTMKELLKIPHFSKLDFLRLGWIPEAFDLETFYSFMKNNKTVKIQFFFDDPISDGYKNRLEEIVDEILTTETRGYKSPVIYFPGLDED